LNSNFQFLCGEWPDIFDSATKAESLAHADPRASCFYARRTLELAIHWLYKADPALKLPYQDNLSALLHEPTFKNAAGDSICSKASLIHRVGNQAVHSHKPIRQFDAITINRELFHFCFWLARNYARQAKPNDSLAFNPALLLRVSSPTSPQNLDQLQRLEAQLREKDEKLSQLLGHKSKLDEELKRLQAEIAAAKAANAAKPDLHDYSEKETRDYFIDLLLKEAGWALAKEGHDTEFPVTGMPNSKGSKGEGFVDYVLWGDDGKPLGLVEAKRTRKSAEVGKTQARLYADCLEKQFGQRPIIFYTNGYDHWLWDDLAYPPRKVQGFYKKDELELLIQRRTARKKLADSDINPQIVERFYQTRAIRRIGEAFERDNERKALVVMATGAGKTRTVIALCDLLMRCNWAKRILFLADRVALVNQAVNAFKKHLPDSSPVNLVTEKDKTGRVYVSTYPTMMGLINGFQDGQRLFGVGHFDLVIIDEAHRSVYQKYRAIFEYFDSLLIGLTATPKDEVDRDTYGLFDLEKGVPTDAYSLEDAVKDLYLVPAKPVSVPVRFQRQGIKYSDLPNEEKEKWDALEWNEDGTIPTEVDPEAVNKWLFNQDTVDKVLEHLMTRGQKVAGGDRLAKTIIFAKNQAHAEFIAKRFDANYPHYKGHFAQLIHCGLPYAQHIIDNFSIPAKAPHIAISVDMLDTGVDVPEVCNLVFFKLVRSKTKFWQMIGRGTRLCRDLFGPGQDKEFFYVFDYCQNLEFFSMDAKGVEGSLSEPLSKRLFKARLEIISTLDNQLQPELMAAEGKGDPLLTLRKDNASYLRDEVASMNLENFVVRAQRKLVEQYRKDESWDRLSLEALHDLAAHVAGLPTELPNEDEEAKRFDLLMFNLQLAELRTEPGFARMRDKVKAIAGLLEEKSNIPMVHQHLELIQELQTDEWWECVTVPMLDYVRKKLRALIKLIDKQQRKPIYTDFEDEIGGETEIQLPGFASLDSYAKFLAKARHFLKSHQNHITIHKLRNNEPLTKSDLAELERIFNESAIGTPEDVAKAKTKNHGLRLFVRSLIGLDRSAAKNALSTFTQGTTLRANQIQFLDEIVNHLTEHGAIEPSRLYESPFTDFSPKGVDGVFDSAQVDKLIALLSTVRERAIA
jgi:type I restriction enzyme, R subunit